MVYLNRSAFSSSRFIMVFVAVSLLILVLLPFSFFGEHKLTEGITLKPDNPPAYSLDVDPGSKLLQLDGPLDIGVADQLRRILEEHPDKTGIVLESDGGNIFQARGMAQLVEARALDTFVTGRCYSACALVFLAGKRRYLGTSAKLGFHGYRIETDLVGPNVDIAQEQQKDQLYFNQKIPDADFVMRIFQQPPEKLWLPEVSELLGAGVVHEVIIQIQ